MRLGIVSDVHCEHEALRAAAEQMTQAGVDEILLAGDAHFEYRFSNDTVDVIRAYGMRYIIGNHEAVLLSPAGSRAVAAPHVRAANVDYMREVPRRLTATVDGRRLTMLHASPWAHGFEYVHAGSPLFDRCDELDTDYLVLGHTHVPMVGRFGRTLVVNPGSLMYSRDPGGHGLPTFAILDTSSDDVFVVRDGVGWTEPVDPTASTGSSQARPGPG